VKGKLPSLDYQTPGEESGAEWKRQPGRRVPGWVVVWGLVAVLVLLWWGMWWLVWGI